MASKRTGKEATSVVLLWNNCHNKDVNVSFSCLLLKQYVKLQIMDTALSKGQSIQISIYGSSETFTIVSYSLKTPDPLSETFFITKQSNVEIKTADSSSSKDGPSNSIAPAIKKPLKSKHMDLLLEMIHICLDGGSALSSIGKPKGILIHGSSGIGKSMLIKQAQAQTPYPFIYVAGYELISKYMGDAEQKIAELFACAKESAPSVIVFDDIHVYANSSEDLPRRLASTIGTYMDTITPKDKVLALAATAKPHEVDPQLRRGGRFDFEIRMEAPNIEERLNLLEAMLDGIEVEADLKRTARETSGFVPADLMALAREACINSWKRAKEATVKVGKEDFEKALFDIRPSNIKDLIAQIPEVHWEDIGGNEEVKELVKQCIEWPLKYPQAFANVGITPPQGILLYGPPGCSKTMIAKAIATESKLNFIGIKGPELFSKYVGDTEKAIRDIFRKARISAPCIIFFDEIDAMATERGENSEGTNVSDRALCQLLNELDGYEPLNQVVVVAATNRPQSIDKALLRPGRMDRLIYVKEPDNDGRVEILKIHTKKMPLEKGVELKDLAKRMEGYSGAEIALACREAGMNALSENIEAKEVKQIHFEKAISKIKPRITEEMRKTYKEFAETSFK